MENKFFPCLRFVFAILLTMGISLTFIVPAAVAHCDTLDGPVVKTAETALQTGDITPVLKWVKEEDEAEIKDLFKKTLVVRSKGKEARELADRYFLETLVRLHRAGEGMPYTGLKPAGAVAPAVVEADKALESGSAENLIKLITEAASQGIQEGSTRQKRPRSMPILTSRTGVFLWKHMSSSPITWKSCISMPQARRNTIMACTNRLRTNILNIKPCAGAQCLKLGQGARII